MKRGFLNNSQRSAGVLTAEHRRCSTSTNLPPSARALFDLPLSQSTGGKKPMLEGFMPVGGPVGGHVGGPPSIDLQFHHRREQIRMGKRPAREEGSSSDFSPAKEPSEAIDQRLAGAFTEDFRRGLTSTNLSPSDLPSPDLPLSQSTRGKSSSLEDFTSVGEPPAKSSEATGLFGPSTGDAMAEVVHPPLQSESESGNRKLCAENQPSEDFDKGKNVSRSNKFSSVNCAESGNRKAEITKLKEWFQERMRENKLRENGLAEHSPRPLSGDSKRGPGHDSGQLQDTLRIKKRAKNRGGDLPKPTDPIAEKAVDDWSETVPARNRKITTKHPKRARKVVQNQADLQQTIGDQKGILGKHPPMLFHQVDTQLLGDRNKTRNVNSDPVHRPNSDAFLKLRKPLFHYGKVSTEKAQATSQKSVIHLDRAQSVCSGKRSDLAQKASIFHQSRMSAAKPFDSGDKSFVNPVKPGATLSSSSTGHSPHLVAYVNQRTKQVGFIERHPSLSINHHESRDGIGSGPTTFKILCANKRKINCVLSSRTISDDHHLPPSEEIHHMVVQDEVLQGQSRLNDVQDVSTDIHERGTCISTKRSRSWLHPKQLGRSVRRCDGLNQKRNSFMDGSSKQRQRGARPFILSQKRKLISEDNFVVVKVPKLEASVRLFHHRSTSLDHEFQFGVPEIVPQQSPQPP